MLLSVVFDTYFVYLFDRVYFYIGKYLKLHVVGVILDFKISVGEFKMINEINNTD